MYKSKIGKVNFPLLSAFFDKLTIKYNIIIILRKSVLYIKRCEHCTFRLIESAHQIYRIYLPHFIKNYSLLLESKLIQRTKNRLLRLEKGHNLFHRYPVKWTQNFQIFSKSCTSHICFNKDWVFKGGMLKLTVSKWQWTLERRNM